MEYNHYSTRHAMAASSCWMTGSPSCYPVNVLVFDFPAASLRIFNACGDPLYYSLAGNASTGTDFLAGCSTLTLTGIPLVGGIALLTTSSSCTSRPQVGVSAWASA